MPIKHILCVSNLSLVSLNAEYAAIKLAHAFKCKLTILSCGEYYAHVPNNYFDENVIQPINDTLHNENYIKHLKQKKSETIDYFSLRQKDLNLDISKNISYEIKLENEVTATLDFLDEKKADFDLIIVGKQNNSHWERLLFGSPAKEICDEAKIPTLLIPNDEKWKLWAPTGILTCTSLSDESNKTNSHDSTARQTANSNVLNMGAEIAKKFSAELTITHVISEDSNQFNNNFNHIVPMEYIPPQTSEQTIDEMRIATEQEIDAIIQDLKKTSSLKKVNGNVEVGQVSDCVTNYLKNFPKNNLLIIGSRGENALKRFFLGSNTDTLEEVCHIPILIVFHKSL